MGLTQEELAHRLRVSPRTTSRWELGESEPQPWYRPALARHLDVTVEELDRLLFGSNTYEFENAVPLVSSRRGG